MRVPSVGMPLDERIIVREGYRWAERMMRGYQDPPTFTDKLAASLMDAGRTALALCRKLLHG